MSSFYQRGQTILYLWLIVTIGLISPLVQVNQLSSHHGVPSYQFGFSVSRPLPAQLVEKLSGRSSLVSSIQPQTYRRALPRSTQQFQAETGFMVLTIQHVSSLFLNLVGTIFVMLLLAYPTWLAPPDKPPRSIL
ncbi:hypothetical protein QUF64_00925 [Anaerolineales bacterium HSG6]|nr:hypothetical protein [Anaerolineales bacterium HSG6]